MTDPVTAALETAIEAAPDNDVLRLHLVSLLLDGGNAQRALEHCTTILSRKPDHVEALTKAAAACDRLGDTSRADSYRRLAAALGAAPQPPQPLPPPQPLHPQPEQQEQQQPPAQPKPADDELPRNVVQLKAIEGGAGAVDFDVERPPVTLADVAGMDEVKRRLNLAFLAPMRNPSLRKLYGKSLRGGLLLYGPPGCGKTFIARATAGELNARFMSVGLSEVLEMWLGQSERNLHEIFENARRNAPCVLFFDEIDALGRKRSLQRHSASANVVNQLLFELDSVGANNDGVFVLAATNHPWDVDSALRRPGRFDRILLVLPPDRTAREAIINLHLRDRPVEGIDASAIAAKTEDFSGADLAHLCESAAEVAMEESFTTGETRPITQADFKRALREVRPSTRTWFDTARNFAQFANEGGVYDDLLAYMRARRMV